MFRQIFDGMCLIVLTVAIHGTVLGWSLTALEADLYASSGSVLAIIWLLSRLAIYAILAHLVEILIWGIYYTRRGVVPGLETAFYFSAVTYATIGYGDVLPAPKWRVLVSMEGLTGILMCAWSGGYFFAVVSKIYSMNGGVPV